MTPVHHAGNNDPIDIAKNFLERLAFFGRLGGERSQNRARLVVRRDRAAILYVAENPQSNPPVHAIVCGIPQVKYHQAIVDRSSSL